MGCKNTKQEQAFAKAAIQAIRTCSYPAMQTVLPQGMVMHMNSAARIELQYESAEGKHHLLKNKVRVFCSNNVPDHGPHWKVCSYIKNYGEYPEDLEDVEVKARLNVYLEDNTIERTMSLVGFGKAELWHEINSF
jgi:hypothetical protein